MGTFKVGDNLPTELLGINDDACPAETDHLGFTAFCNLDAGHKGTHLAGNSDLVVVAAWE
ncbi:hypothetical protein ACIQTZ_07860 [Paenarthrobacter sp. NPDC090520]|uniref:hypothetical protein n=1 Tax=unclassified Paenarthrobacter TaxID=2634190 RepID=UPI0037CA6FE6